jgi:two-component system sensor histidine kinase YesM
MVHNHRSNKLLKKGKPAVSLSSSVKKLIWLIVLVVVLSFLVSAYFISKKELEDYTVSESESIIKTLSSNIDADIEKYSELSRLIMTENRLVRFLRADAESVDIGMINDARYGVMDILNVTEGVDCIMIFREDMIMVATNRFTYKYDYILMNSDSWRGDIYAGKGKAVVSLNSNKVAAKNDGRPLVTIGRAIYDIDTQKRTGLMLMNISTSVFENMLGELGYSDICIMGTDGTFLAGNSEYASFYSKEYEENTISHKFIKSGRGRRLLSGSRIKDYPIVILRGAQVGNEGLPMRIIYILIFLLLVFIIITAYVGFFLNKNITAPVLSLSASMEENRRYGNLKKLEIETPYSEYELLKGDYNNMIDHVNELIETVIEKEKTLQRAEMRVLQEQIKPHFLYNSIETIGFLALEAGAENVHDALETLGSFYRNFLSKGDREIPLSKEICIVKDYLSLQKLRYGDIIKDVYEIDPDTESFVVPKLILQPLVENCIYHGIRMKGEPGTIRISSHITEEHLHLTVRDTGVGMSSEQIERIIAAGNENPENVDDSFGLWGTIQRVRFYCGRDDVVRIKSEIGEYTEVEFII